MASCNCAVAVKMDDDVILFDRCGAKAGGGANQPMNIQIIKNGDIDPGLRIQRYNGGTKYKVGLPSSRFFVVVVVDRLVLILFCHLLSPIPVLCNDVHMKACQIVFCSTFCFATQSKGCFRVWYFNVCFQFSHSIALSDGQTFWSGS